MTLSGPGVTPSKSEEGEPDRNGRAPAGAQPLAARLFVAGDLADSAPVALTAGQAHYLRSVLRLAPGAALALFNGRDGEWIARLDTVSKAGGVATAERRCRLQQGSPDIWLCFAPIKRPGIDIIAEKATELGVSVLQPVTTRHTHVGRVNIERLAANAIEAAEQCERLDVPDIRNPLGLEALLSAWPVERPLLVAVETGAGQPLAAAALALRGHSVGLLIGPEGGFARSELDGLSKLAFVHRVSLGPRILRAETAALAALACWQCIAGDGAALPPNRTKP